MKTMELAKAGSMVFFVSQRGLRNFAALFMCYLAV